MGAPCAKLCMYEDAAACVYCTTVKEIGQENKTSSMQNCRAAKGLLVGSRPWNTCLHLTVLRSVETSWCVGGSVLSEMQLHSTHVRKPCLGQWPSHSRGPLLCPEFPTLILQVLNPGEMHQNNKEVAPEPWKAAVFRWVAGCQGTLHKLDSTYRATSKWQV